MPPFSSAVFLLSTAVSPVQRARSSPRRLSSPHHVLGSLRRLCRVRGTLVHTGVHGRNLTARQPRRGRQTLDRVGCESERGPEERRGTSNTADPGGKGRSSCNCKRKREAILRRKAALEGGSK